MPTYKITVYREWREYGYLEIDAESEDEARDEARFALAIDDEAILWHSDRMEPEEQGVESIEREGLSRRRAREGKTERTSASRSARR